MGLHDKDRNELLTYLRNCPYYETITVNGKQYFLSHAGLDVSLPFNRQNKEFLTWAREEFYNHKALDGYTCIFGHTQTYYLHDDGSSDVWFDPVYKDKIDIDCGCAYGGKLAAIRLDDEKVFYIKSSVRKEY
jgi:serine/threonine protein phosphatase 1